MSDGDDFNKMRTIFDRVENSIITDADPPSIPRADELPASGWRGSLANDLKAWITRTRITLSNNLTSFLAEPASLIS